MKYPIYDIKGNITLHIDIDKTDLPMIKEYTWRLMGRGYIKAKINKKDVYLHRFVMKETDPIVKIDHINNDPLDNRKKNLRRVDMRQNAFNRTKTTKESSSQYKGVSYNKTTGKWIAYIKIHGIKYTLGSFDNEKEASKKYNEKAKELFGEYSKLNK
jgi:hypothetical protein